MTCVPQCYQCGSDLHLLESVDDGHGAPPQYDLYEEWQTVCALCRNSESHSRRRKLPVREMIRAYEEATGTCVGCD